MDIFDFTKTLEKAVYDELSREFAFGCVNFSSTGSHPDMTYEDFILSIKAICKGFEQTNWDRISDFDSLRKRGLEIERDMFKATSGKNTYKGLVFLSIILGAGFVKTYKIEQIPQFVIKFSKPLILDYKSSNKAIFYKNLGLRDVRFYPLSGFEEIFDLSLKSYNSPMDDLLLTLYLIANVDDTTSLNRASLSELRFLQGWAKKIYHSYQKGEDISKEVRKLNSYYLTNQITSGGVADIFTLTKTLFYLRRIYE